MGQHGNAAAEKTRQRSNATAGQRDNAATGQQDDGAARRHGEGKNTTAEQHDGGTTGRRDNRTTGQRNDGETWRRGNKTTKQHGNAATGQRDDGARVYTIPDIQPVGRRHGAGGIRRQTGHGAGETRRRRDTARAGYGERQSITHKKQYLSVQTIWSRTGGTRSTSRSAPLMCGDRTPPISERNYASRANLL